MKGIILCGGMGTRLKPLTDYTNKHLLPVFDKPMIWYSLETFAKMDITDIMIITGPENAGDFLRYLGSGRDFGCSFTYKLQDEAGGIAHALMLAEDFVGYENCAVILGDNIFEDKFDKARDMFEEKVSETMRKSHAMVFLKKVKNPERFGVAVVNKNNIIEKLIEKPKELVSNMAQTGLYLYTSDVFDVIKKLKPSDRGELEITDVNQFYLERGRLLYDIVDGYWSDAGTFDSLHKAYNHLARKKLKS